MIDVNKEIVTALHTATNLNVYYELVEHEYPIPCITYQCYDNSQNEHGDTLAYSSIAFYIKLWGKSLSTLMPYQLQIDTAMNNLGYSRESYNELAINDELCLIAQYRGMAKEERN